MTDIEIAQKNVMDPITDVAAKIDIPVDKLELYGPIKQKLLLTNCRHYKLRLQKILVSLFL